MSTALQLLSNVYSHPSPDAPKIKVLYAAQSLDSLEMVPDLASFAHAHPQQVSLGVWVERLGGERGMLGGVEPTPATVRPLAQKTGWFAKPAAPKRYLLSVGERDIPLSHGRLAPADLVEWTTPGDDGERLVLVCGPDGFVRAVAGAKGRDLLSQGPLRGMLASLGYRPNQVVKL